MGKQSSTAPPYQSASYFNKQFLKESKMSVGGNFLASGLLNDVSGKYINIINGRRVTTNTPDDVQGKILILAGPPYFVRKFQTI